MLGVFMLIYITKVTEYLQLLSKANAFMENIFNTTWTFDGNLHCWSPLLRTTPTNNPMLTDGTLTCNKLWKGSRYSLVSVTSSPIGHLTYYYYYYYYTRNMNTFKEFFVIRVL
jgi:hypothetical protein